MPTLLNNNKKSPLGFPKKGRKPFVCPQKVDARPMNTSSQSEDEEPPR